jgi:acyl dehydratase
MTARERARQNLEDYAAGQIYCSARMTIDKDQIGADPQPYHLDEEAAHKSVFGGLAASDWHTAALTMRLLVDSEFKPTHGILGVGVDELRWLRPARPGDDYMSKPKCWKCGRLNRRPTAA